MVVLTERTGRAFEAVRRLQKGAHEASESHAMAEAAARAKHVAIVGAGYAGWAAAVTLVDAGHRVSVFETNRTPGGRARRVVAHGREIDNGEHILLGAYAQTLALIERVHGRDSHRDGQLFLRRPLHLEEPNRFRFRAAALPAPWHALGAFAGARGLGVRSRLATMRFVQRAKRARFRCAPSLTVAELLADAPGDATRALWEPLCLAALNTPIESASAQIFLNVLRAAFAGTSRDSDVLLPRVDLTALFPEPAAAYVAARGGNVELATHVDALALDDGRVRLSARGATRTFDAAIVAVGPHQLVDLARNGASSSFADALACVSRFAYEPIATVYLQYEHPLELTFPMLKLDGDPGQWIFDRGVLGGAPGLAAVVISTETPALSLERDALLRAVHAQLEHAFGPLGGPAWSQVITERRATYACVANLARPVAGALAPGIYLAGDYTDAEFPATLEAATRSGVRAARALIASSRS